MEELDKGLKPKTRRKIELKLEGGWTFDAEAWAKSVERHKKWNMADVFTPLVAHVSPSYLLEVKSPRLSCFEGSWFRSWIALDGSGQERPWLMLRFQVIAMLVTKRRARG